MSPDIGDADDRKSRRSTRDVLALVKSILAASLAAREAVGVRAGRGSGAGGGAGGGVISSTADINGD